ncbi:MAG: uroporphyrinogen decarboxylase family protein [Candidatus Humimicrobiaceae bacterium]
MTNVLKRKYQKKINFIKKIFDFDYVERPAYVIGPGIAIDYDDFSEVYLNSQLQLSTQLNEFKIRENLRIEDDYIPMLMPWFGGVIEIVEAFGGKVQWYKKDNPKILPIFESTKDIMNLKKPNVKEGLLGILLERTKYFQEETNFKYPIAVSVHSSPLEIIFALMETSKVIFAMIDTPRLIHHLLEIVTETLIDFIEEQKRVAKELTLGFSLCSTGIYIPEGYGIFLGVDSMVNLSPELHKEFSIPYLNILSEKYGGVFLHSCGNFEHLIDSLKLIRNLRGIDFGASETSYEKVVENFAGKVVIAPHLGFNRRIKFNSLEDFTNYIIKNKKMDTGNYFQIQDINSLGYENDINKKIGSFKCTSLSSKEIKKLEKILKS